MYLIMKNEDKELLLKDLCARLPYDVRVEYNGTALTNIFDVLGIAHGRIMLCLPFMSKTECPLIEEVKPYLFPLSSMTVEQKRDYQYITERWMNDPTYIISDSFDWLHKNHFDYRGLIEKGLAIDATGKNIY